LLPGLLGQVHVGYIKMALGGEFLRTSQQALLFLGLLGGLGLFLRSLGSPVPPYPRPESRRLQNKPS
jgi:hypothetical protein